MNVKREKRRKKGNNGYFKAFKLKYIAFEWRELSHSTSENEIFHRNTFTTSIAKQFTLFFNCRIQNLFYVFFCCFLCNGTNLFSFIYEFNRSNRIKNRTPFFLSVQWNTFIQILLCLPFFFFLLLLLTVSFILVFFFCYVFLALNARVNWNSQLWVDVIT